MISNITFFIAIYTIIWWFVFFISLPIAIKSQRKSEQKTGLDKGAPQISFLKIKFILTSIVTAILTTSLFALIQKDIFINILMQ